MSVARAGGQSRHSRLTMKDVAALAGVAIKTVSRVIRFLDADAVASSNRPDAIAAVDHLGRLAAQLLFARLDGDDSLPRTHVVPTGIVVRGSGEIRPVPTAASSG